MTAPHGRRDAPEGTGSPPPPLPLSLFQTLSLPVSLPPFFPPFLPLTRRSRTRVRRPPCGAAEAGTIGVRVKAPLALSLSKYKITRWGHKTPSLRPVDPIPPSRGRLSFHVFWHYPEWFRCYP